MKDIHKRIEKYLNKDYSLRQLKIKITNIKNKIEESMNINSSSTNLLNFYVNDLLDFA